MMMIHDDAIIPCGPIMDFFLIIVFIYATSGVALYIISVVVAG